MMSEDRMRQQLRARQTLDQQLPFSHGQPDAAVHGRIADDRLGIFTLLDGFQVAQEALPLEDDAEVARSEMLFGPVRADALSHPGHESLVHDMARDPAAPVPITSVVTHQAVPRWDLFLRVRLALLGHASEGPGDAQ